jgi:hypothetical protein
MVRAGDLAGERFGGLVALPATGERGSGSLMWQCRCDRGREVSEAGPTTSGTEAPGPAGA